MSTTETLSTPPPAKPTVEPLVRLEGVKKHFPITRGIIFQRKVGAVLAVDGVDLEIFPGETLGLVGETGCGKSTLARVVMRLHSLTEGKLWFDGRDVSNIRGRDLRDLRRDMQMVFQDPYASLNPRKTVGSSVVRGVYLGSTWMWTLTCPVCGSRSTPETSPIRTPDLRTGVPGATFGASPKVTV